MAKTFLTALQDLSTASLRKILKDRTTQRATRCSVYAELLRRRQTRA